jgi:hypothetical protein
MAFGGGAMSSVNSFKTHIQRHISEPHERFLCGRINLYYDKGDLKEVVILYLKNHLGYVTP